MTLKNEYAASTRSGARVSVVSMAHDFAAAVLSPGDLAVDATAGNGRDTVFLARATGETGRVFAFDVQPEAIENTRRLAEKEGLLERITLFERGHESMEECLQSYAGRIRAVMFNLGYLPGGDKTRVTRPPTTLLALRAALILLAPGGRLTVVAYPGHPGGEEEAGKVREWVRSLPPDSAEVFDSREPSRNPPSPFLLVLEKR